MPDADVAHHRPRFHIRPEVGFVNDPNGPVIVDGVAHLYFQYRTPMQDNPFVLWGHATSEDLVRWTLQRPALVPHPAGGDREGCWSGNTVAHDGSVVAFYSGFRAEHPYQSVLAAVSSDGGRSFGPPVQAVPDPAEHERITSFRDPFVWDQDGAWWMVVGAGDADSVASARLYRSDDLEAWTSAGVLASLPRTELDGIDTGAMWECPQVVRVDGEDVLLVGSWSQEAGIDQVLSVRGAPVGADPGPLTIRPLDAGRNLYAASALRESGSGPVVWGWITEGREEDAVQAAGWSGTISLPRRIRLGADGSVLSEPVPSAVHLRAAEADVAALGAQAELEIRATRASVVRLRFSGEEELTLRVDPAADAVTIDRTGASVDPSAHRDVTVVADAFRGAAPEVRVFLDGSVVEVFTSGGRVATLRVYPAAAPPWRVEADGADVRAWVLHDSRTVDVQQA